MNPPHSGHLTTIYDIPDDGGLLPKHVGASIYNKAVVQICALCKSVNGDEYSNNAP
jgi:hypothetical protein